MKSETFELLKQLGFSETECSIYFSLLDKPQGEAIDMVVSRTGESSNETEHAINSLVDRGILRVTSNRLEAVEPKQFLGRLEDLKRTEVSRNLENFTETSARLLNILEPHYWEIRLGIRPEEILEPLPTLQEMEVRTVKVIANSTRIVSISAETFGWLTKIREEVDLARERGVKLRVLMSGKDNETMVKAEEAKSLGFETRSHQDEWYPVRGTLGDERELVFLIWATKEKTVDKPKYFRPHYSRNPGMIRIFSDAFEKRWNEAKQL